MNAQLEGYWKGSWKILGFCKSGRFYFCKQIIKIQKWNRWSKIRILEKETKSETTNLSETREQKKTSCDTSSWWEVSGTISFPWWWWEWNIGGCHRQGLLSYTFPLNEVRWSGWGWAASFHIGRNLCEWVLKLFACLLGTLTRIHRY